MAEDRRTNETGEPFRVEFRKIRRDGRVIWVRDEAVLLKTPEGRPLYWQGIFADVTEHKRAEEALKHSEERYRRLVENSPDTIAVLGEEKVLFINAAGAKHADDPYFPHLFSFFPLPCSVSSDGFILANLY